MNSYRIEWKHADGFSGSYFTKNPWIARMVRDRAVKFGMKAVKILMLDVTGMKVVKEVF